MTGPVSPGASSRPSAATMTAQRTEAAIALLEAGHTHQEIRDHLGCGAEFVARAAVEWRRRMALAAERLQPERTRAAIPRAYAPPPPPPPADSAQAERLTLVARLRCYAQTLPQPQRSTLLHLSDLAEHHPTFYPSYAIRSDGTVRGMTHPPANYHALSGLSPSASCLEG